MVVIETLCIPQVFRLISEISPVSPERDTPEILHQRSVDTATKVLMSLSIGSVTLRRKYRSTIEIVRGHEKIADLREMLVNDTMQIHFNDNGAWIHHSGYDGHPIVGPPTIGRSMTISLSLREFIDKIRTIDKIYGVPQDTLIKLGRLVVSSFSLWSIPIIWES